MSRDETQSLPNLTAADFEAGLAEIHAEAEGEPRLKAAFNPAEFARKAKALLKYAPGVLTALAAAGVPLPAGAVAIAKLVIGLADAFDLDAVN